MHTRPLRLLAALAVLLGGPAVLELAPLEASQVDRAAVTLGRLADTADVIVVGRVEGVDEVQVRLVVEEEIKGRVGESCVVPAGPLGFVVGQRVALFLNRDREGGLAAPRTPWVRLLLSEHDPAHTRALLDALRGRLPRVGGDPKVARRALFSQLEAKHTRLREDASLDLVAYRELSATPKELDHLARALASHATPALLLLAERLRARRLLEPVLATARAAKGEAMRLAAARALAAIDRVAGLAALGQDLESSSAATASSALACLACLPGAEVEGILAQHLSDRRAEVRLAAIRGLAARGKVEEPTLEAVEARVWQSAGRERRLAMAALAQLRAGRALARIGAEHGEEAIRRLALELRRDPVRAPRRILRARSD
jgi:hypothetical protein